MILKLERYAMLVVIYGKKTLVISSGSISVFTKRKLDNVLSLDIGNNSALVNILLFMTKNFEKKLVGYSYNNSKFNQPWFFYIGKNGNIVKRRKIKDVR